MWNTTKQNCTFFINQIEILYNTTQHNIYLLGVLMPCCFHCNTSLSIQLYFEPLTPHSSTLQPCCPSILLFHVLLVRPQLLQPCGIYPLPSLSCNSVISVCVAAANFISSMSFGLIYFPSQLVVSDHVQYSLQPSTTQYL